MMGALLFTFGGYCRYGKCQKIKLSASEDKTFQDGFGEYVLDMKSRNLRAGTITHYQQSIKQIYKHIPPDTLISSFSSTVMPQFLIELRDNPKLNEVSMGTYARDLKTLMRFFMKRHYIPYFEIKIPKADKEPIEIYTDAELKILMKKPDVHKCSFAEYRTWVIVNFLLSTGMRQNSLINVRCKDIDFENKMVYVNITKNRKPLIIPLNDDIVSILQEYFKYRCGKADDYLFCNIYSAKLTRSGNYTALWDYAKARGLEKTGVHRFRHTFAKKWVLLGGSVVTLQKILGHSSLEMTENYLNLLTSDLQEEIEEFNILRSLKREYKTMK